MTGKVLKESANIYQDQAKVLFDYYRAAAEKIVSEEMKCEQREADLNKQINEAEAQKKKNQNLAIILGAVGLVAIIAAFFTTKLLLVLGVAAVAAGAYYYLIKNRALDTQIQEWNTMLEQVGTDFDNIRRDYYVDRIGVAYVPVATRVPFEDKSFLIDHTNTVDNKTFQVTLLKDPDAFRESIEKLQESMEKMPVVETTESPETISTADYSLSVQNITLHDYAGNIDRQVRNISYLLGDNEQASVEIPAITPKSEEASFIEEFATTDTGDKPIVRVFDADFDDKLSKFTRLNETRNQFKEVSAGDSTDYLKGLIGQLAESVQMMSIIKNSGASKLAQYTSSIFGLVLKAGYTQYSPQLEAEEIERIRGVKFDYKTEVNDYEPFSLKKSSVVKYDLFSGNWVAEDDSRTTMPFGMHQVDEEVIMPVIASLMEENRLERARIYNNIEDQKRIYLDRWSSEIGNYFRDNRGTADELINRMRETYTDYTSSYSMYRSLQDTADLMKGSKSLEDTEVQEQDAEAELIAGFEMQAEACNEQMRQFTDYMDRIMEDINQMTEDFAHIEYYEGSLRDSVSHDTAVAMANVYELKPRQKALLSISPYIASYAQLPPEPNTTEDLVQDVQIDLEQQAQEELNEINMLQSGGMGYGSEEMMDTNYMEDMADIPDMS